jgi:4-hydroxybenzoate polyprenyltransferase
MLMKHLLQLIDLFFLPRPLLLIPVWGFCSFGYYHGLILCKNASIGSLWSIDSLHAFAWFVLFSFSVASVHILNQLADIDVDKANRGLPLLAKGKISLSAAQIAAGICALIGVVAPLFKHPYLSAGACAAVLLGALYSFQPFRLSGRFCLDFLTNATGYGVVAFGAGWYISGAPFAAIPFFASALPYFFLMCAGSISSTIPDYHGDKQYGKNTTAVVLGIMKAHVLSTFFLCLALTVALLTHNYSALTCAFCALPLYVLYFIHRDPRIMEATYKIGGFLFMALASILMPFLGGAAIVISLLTFIYFKKRHHTSYPSLNPSTYEN